MLTTVEGTRLTSVFVRHFVGVSLNRQLIRDWRFEQVGRDSYVFSYVPLAEDGLEANLLELYDGFRRALGESAEVELRRETQLLVEASGKKRWIVNRYASAVGRPAPSSDERSGPGSAGC
jgi:hypothetical protein